MIARFHKVCYPKQISFYCLALSKSHVVDGNTDVLATFLAPTARLGFLFLFAPTGRWGCFLFLLGSTAASSHFLSSLYLLGKELKRINLKYYKES